MTLLQVPKATEDDLIAPEYLPDTTATTPPPQTAKFSWRAKVRSLFLVALAFFLTINATFTFTNAIRFDPYRYAYKGWAWWTMDDLRHSAEVHNVALLGSSLMVSAVAGCDANYTQKALDLTKYHRCAYLDDKMHDAFGGTFNTFNLSAPGQMPSDAFLSLKAMAATGNRPDVVVYGVAPRDFIDSMLSGPNDTEPFKYLSRIVNIDDVSNAEFRSMWSKLDWYLQKLVFFYSYALDIRLALGEAAEKTINIAIPCPFSKHPFTWWDRVKMLPNYVPAEIHPEAVISGPIARNKITFVDNTKEYQARYRTPDPHTYRTQMYFLRKLAEYCHKERIELVLVNMPITYFNARMLPAGIYEKYVAALREFAWNQNVVFYDLCDFKKYTNEDFHDTVHLNGFGAQKLFDTLMSQLVKDPRASTALGLAGMQLEKHTSLASHGDVWTRSRPVY